MKTQICRLHPFKESYRQRIYVKNLPHRERKFSLAIEQYPSKHNYFVASVQDVVGHVTDPGIDVLEVLESMDIVSGLRK